MPSNSQLQVAQGSRSRPSTVIRRLLWPREAANSSKVENAWGFIMPVALNFAGTLARASLDTDAACPSTPCIPVLSVMTYFCRNCIAAGPYRLAILRGAATRLSRRSSLFLRQTDFHPYPRCRRANARWSPALHVVFSAGPAFPARRILVPLDPPTTLGVAARQSARAHNRESSKAPQAAAPCGRNRHLAPPTRLSRRHPGNQLAAGAVQAVCSRIAERTDPASRSCGHFTDANLDQNQVSGRKSGVVKGDPGAPVRIRDHLFANSHWPFRTNDVQADPG